MFTGRARTVRGTAIIGCCLALLMAACGGSTGTQKAGTTATPNTEEKESTRPSRGVIACRLHSCAPPYFCNEESGVCEMLPCKSKKDCPYDYKCDFSLNVCR